jgi:hypothetical protein
MYEGEWRAGRMHGGGPCGNQNLHAIEHTR